MFRLFRFAKRLSKDDLPGLIIVRKVAGENPANKSGTTADRRGWCFHQRQNGRCFFIFKQLLSGNFPK